MPLAIYPLAVITFLIEICETWLAGIEIASKHNNLDNNTLHITYTLYHGEFMQVQILMMQDLYKGRSSQLQRHSGI